MKKRLLILLGILVIGGAGAGVCWKLGVFGQQEVSGDAAYVTKISELTGDVSGVTNRYAGVVEPQETVKVELESGRTVKEVKVKTGDQVKEGQLLFEYDLTSIQDDLEEANLELDRLKNEAASLNEQIATLQKEKVKAAQEDQLSYTIEIETNKMNLKKNEYSQKSKQSEITKLQNTMGNTEVRSTIDGVIQKIDTSKLDTEDGDSLEDASSMSDYSDMGSDDDSKNAFITILSTGAYRIKGTVNEMNVGNIIEGSPVIVRSRVDENQTWKGVMGAVDRDSANSQSDNNYFYGMVDTSGDSQTNSTTYPFYVELDASDGLMLGQHVYIEMDEGQEEKKAGLWLSEFYIVDADTNEPYVWTAGKDGRLEKRSVILGQYDENLGEYEIADGLTEEDAIAYPTDTLTEGMRTTTSVSEASPDTVDMTPSEGEAGMDAGTEVPMDDTAGADMGAEEIPADDGTSIGSGDVTTYTDENGTVVEEFDDPDGAYEADPGEAEVGGDAAMEGGTADGLPEDEILTPVEGDMEAVE